jgi:hypothetical protein
MNNQNFNNTDLKQFNIFQYIKENLYGFILLVLVFFIIYFVDYLNRLNMIIYLTPTPTPITGLKSIISSPQKISKRKFKKH